MTKLLAIVLVLLVSALTPAISKAQCLDSSDVDNDGIIACEDNCPEMWNPDQEDFWTSDFDNDGIIGCEDNCPDIYNPGQEGNPYPGYGDACCCGMHTGGYPGDINFGEDGKRSLADITLHIDHVYISKNPLPCFANGDLNFDGTINLADITLLIDHVYISKAEFLPCGS